MQSAVQKFSVTCSTLLIYLTICTLAFEDLIYVYGQGNNEMLEQGRIQYQLIKEKGSLPKYGSCWKSAVEHLNEGCRHLSEETQSDIALHITNCFLEMSGHETYNCELDKKPNLRGICINSMTDRAFNVYTEFYTHTQNICWFLRGQIWHETIAQNTLKVGKQLEVSAQAQEDLLRAQKDSLELQEKMLKQGRFLEQTLEDLYISTRAHQELLSVLSQSIVNLQAWIVGEISWIDSIIFYASATFLSFLVTSSPRTASARFPLFLLLFLNLCLERFICSIMSSNTNQFDTRDLYSSIYVFVWYSRYAFTFLALFILLYFVFTFKDLNEQNHQLLSKLQNQNTLILEAIKSNLSTPEKSDLRVVNECSSKALEAKLSALSNKTKDNYYSNNKHRSPSFVVGGENDIAKENPLQSTRKTLFSVNEGKKYNLRSRQGTPDTTVI